MWLSFLWLCRNVLVDSIHLSGLFTLHQHHICSHRVKWKLPDSIVWIYSSPVQGGDLGTKSERELVHSGARYDPLIQIRLCLYGISLQQRTKAEFKRSAACVFHGSQKEYTLETSSALCVGRVCLVSSPHCETLLYLGVLMCHRAFLAFGSKYNIVTFLYVQSG